MSVPTWESAKHLLGEFDCVATEIFVGGLPISQLPVVIAALAELPALEVVTFQSEGLETYEPFDTRWRSRFESKPSVSCQHSLLSATGTAQHLQVYLWIDLEAAVLELELVFWNDITFPRGLELGVCKQRLQSLVSLAEACRVGVSDARCVLAAEHNGPIEELLQNDHVVLW